MSDITFRLTGGTNVGLVRTNNEDNFIVNADLTQTEWFIPSDTSKEISLGELGCLFVVADGMGGMNAGEVASAIAIDSVKKAFTDNNLQKIISSPLKIKKFLQRTVEIADGNIKAKVKEDPSTSGMGTTIVIGWVLNNTLHVSWCGDSRAYLFNPASGLIRLSKDHSYVQQLVDAGKLDPELAFDHPNSNIITRSLGDSSVKALPDYTSRTLFAGDLVFLCSDGLCGLCRDEEILEVLNSQTESIEQRKSDLITAALDAGGHDNVTVVMFEMVSVKEDESKLLDANTHNDFKAPRKGFALTCKHKKITLIVCLLLILAALVFWGVRYYTSRLVVEPAGNEQLLPVGVPSDKDVLLVEPEFEEETPVAPVKSELEEEVPNVPVVSVESVESEAVESELGEEMADEENSTAENAENSNVESKEPVEAQRGNKIRDFFKEKYEYVLNKFRGIRNLNNEVK